MKICVIGTGYVGLVSGTCLAELGHEVTCLDIDEQKIERLSKGLIPIHEPGLDDLVMKNVSVGRLSFSTSYEESVPDREIVMIAVGTPAAEDGRADLQYVYAAAKELAQHLNGYTVIVDKSTVPVGTGEEVAKIVKTETSEEFDVVSCPEFLREGQAVNDFMNPDRIVIGGERQQAIDATLKMFEKISALKIVTNTKSAELIKYASNAFLATKISFINEIANVCDVLGADVEEVARGMGTDVRIGPHFLKSGVGYGGSCFPKDVSALGQMAGGNGYDFHLLKAVIEVNNRQRTTVMDKLKKHYPSLEGKKIAVLGLAFKKDTDDIRESAAIDIIKLLNSERAVVTAYDPVATNNARNILSDVSFAVSARDAVKDADAVMIVTEWDEFQRLDWDRIKSTLAVPLVIDGRNILDRDKMTSMGYTYEAVGRST